MEKRYQVFVSSTYVDLLDERREVLQALLELDCLPAAMEIFPAADDDQWTLIQRVIDESDYYVVVVGGRYGSLSEAGISYTEREYDYAVSIGKPILGFVHGDPDSIPVGKTDKDAAASRKLDEFRAKVRTRVVKEFTSPTELGSVVSRSLIRLMKDKPAEGWIRGRHALTPEVQSEIAELRERIATSELERLTQQAASTVDPGEGLAQGAESVELDYAVFEYGHYRRLSGTWHYTWDEIFSLLGPMMFDEASESAMRERLEADLLTEVGRRHTKQVQQVSSPESRFEDKSWGQIIVQLRAIGLIDKGAKRRGVADRAAYWRLTDRGENHLMRLMALPTGVTKATGLPMAETTDQDVARRENGE